MRDQKTFNSPHNVDGFYSRLFLDDWPFVTYKMVGGNSLLPTGGPRYIHYSRQTVRIRLNSFKNTRLAGQVSILQNNFQGKHGWVVSNDFYLDSTETNIIFIRAKGDQGLNERCPSDIAEWISEGGGTITFSIACEADGDRQRCPPEFPFAFNEGEILINKF